MPQGRTAEIRDQGRQEAAGAGRPLGAFVPLIAASLIWPATAGAAEPWLGRWIVDPKFCKEVGDTSDTMPLIIRASTMEWFVARCTYRGARKLKDAKRGERWHIDARCSAEGSRGATPIVLSMPDRDRLDVRWGGGQPIAMQRCTDGER